MDSVTLKEWLAGLIALDRTKRSLDVVNLSRRIVREIYHREGPGCLARAEQSGHPPTFGEFINCLAREDALAAVDWLERFKKVVRDQHGNDDEETMDSHIRSEMIHLLPTLFHSALRQGEDVALELHDRLRPDIDRSGMTLTLPDGFDVGKYLGAQKPNEVLRNPGVSEFLEFWALRDRDAAFAFALRIAADAPPGSLDLPFAAFQGVCKMDGEQAAAGWLSDSLAGTPAEERARILNRFFEYQALSPAAYQAILSGLQDEADRIAFGGVIFHSRAALVAPLTYLETIDSMELRAGIIEFSAAKRLKEALPPEEVARCRESYEAVMSAAGIPEESRARVRALWR